MLLPLDCLSPATLLRTLQLVPSTVSSLAAQLGKNLFGEKADGDPFSQAGSSVPGPKTFSAVKSDDAVHVDHVMSFEDF